MDIFCSSPTPKVLAVVEEDWLPSNHEASISSTDKLTKKTSFLQSENFF